MKTQIVTVLTAMGTMFCVDDTLTGKHSISSTRNRHDIELEAMPTNCSAEDEEINLCHPYIDSDWC